MAVIQRKSAREVIGATVGGMVSGAVTGAIAASSLGFSCVVAGDAVGEAAGSFVRQWIEEGAISEVSAKEVANDAVSGAVGAVLNKGISDKLFNPIKENALSKVESKFASQEVKEVFKKEVKTEFYNKGQVLGKAGKTQLKKEVEQRLSDHENLEKALVSGTIFIEKQTVGSVTSSIVNFTGQYLYGKIKE